LAQVKKEEEITEHKIYSPVGKFVERAKQPRWQGSTNTTQQGR